MPPEPRTVPDAAPRPPRPSFRPTGPIVRAAETGTFAEAVAAREAAEAYAERTRRWARAAYQRARERGLEDGRKEGAAEAARLAQTARDEVRQLLVTLDAELPRLVLDLVRNLLGAFEPGELLPFAVRKAMERLDEAAEIRVKVAPPLYDAMRRALAETGDTARLRVEADPGLAPGACVIWSDVGNVELSLDAQLAALREQLPTEAFVR